ncbi:MAG: response regulator [Candidatus Acidiferrales bacterium]|jgi:PAS domain S-box-containing protein
MSQTIAIPSLTIPGKTSTSLRVMVIENSITDAELTLHELDRAGFQCKAKIIGARGDFLAQLPRFSYDIVLSGYHLGGWTGMEALTALRQSGSEVPFILVTGILGDELAIDCIKQGITDYVLKQQLTRLPLAVARALEDKSLRDGRTFMMQALRQSETNSLFLFANNPLPMWVLEVETLGFLHVNDAAVDQYGYSRMEFLRMKAGDLHPDGELPALAGAIRNDSPRELQTGQWHHRLKNDSVIDVEMSLQKMEYSGYAAALVVSQNVTERKRTEEERQKLFTLVENSRDFIAVADLNDNVEYVNPAGRALLGFASAEAVKGTRSLDYVIPGDLPLVHETILPALRSVGHWSGELRFRHRETGQALPMDFVGFQIKDPQTGQPRLLATVSRDMTERRALEQQLRQAQKFEAIGQLAGGVAHDFNNVIGAILGWAELGEEQASLSEGQLLTYFKKIHSQCDRVTALVRQLLAFARRQILEPRDLSLNQTVQEVLNLLEGVIGKDIEIHSDLAQDLSVVCADPAQIEQVLMNLCINSRDAMPKGGRLIIETRNVQISVEQCRATPGLKPGAYAQLRVRDTGIGMDSAVRDRIFEPFFTTKGTGKGTGLGLATVYGIVKQHGGFIYVESEEGHGSEFRILLPAVEASAKTEHPLAIIEDKPIRGGTETILIAEDHEGIRETAETVLKSLGYRVLLSSDGEEAVAMFSAHRDDISLVVLDVIMPRRNGAEAYAAISAMKPGVSAIFATGYSNETAALAEIVERGVAVLRKPYSPRTLCRRVREVLDRVARSR